MLTLMKLLKSDATLEIIYLTIVLILIVQKELQCNSLLISSVLLLIDIHIPEHHSLLLKISNNLLTIEMDKSK